MSSIDSASSPAGAALSEALDSRRGAALQVDAAFGIVHAVGVLACDAPDAMPIATVVLAFALPVAARARIVPGAQLVIDGAFLGVCARVHAPSREQDDVSHTYYAVDLAVRAGSALVPGPHERRRVHIELLGDAAPQCLMPARDLYLLYDGLRCEEGAHAWPRARVTRPSAAEDVALPYAPAQYRWVAIVPPDPSVRAPIPVLPRCVVHVRGVFGIVERVDAAGDRALVWFPPTWPHTVAPDLVLPSPAAAAGLEDADGARDGDMHPLICENIDAMRARERVLALERERAQHFMGTALALGDAVRTRTGTEPWTGIIAVDALTGYELARGAASAPVEGAREPHVHAECAVLQHVLSTFEPAPACHRVELYTTHEPCGPHGGGPRRAHDSDAAPISCSDFIALHEGVVARLVYGVLLWSHDGPGAAAPPLARADLRERFVALQHVHRDLWGDVAWALREYRHWVRCAHARPYTTAFVVEALSGWAVEPARITSAPDRRAIDEALGAATCLATALIVDSSAADGGDCPLLSFLAHAHAFDPPLYYACASRDNDEEKNGSDSGPQRLRLPLRVLLTDPRRTKGWTPAARAAALPHDARRGSAVVFTTLEFIAADAGGTAKLAASADYAAAWWPSAPALIVAPRSAHGTPDEGHVLRMLGENGIISAAVACSRAALVRFMRQRLIDEIVFVRVPAFTPATGDADIADLLGAAAEAVPAHDMQLIASARLAQSNVQMDHYQIYYPPG